MNLTTENKELESPKWKLIQDELNKLDGKKNGYLILENNNGDYVQCAGRPEMLTVEYRFNSESNFRHYVIGKGEDRSPLTVSWVILKTNVGEIMVHKEEVLKLQDAEIVFREFYKNQKLPIEFKKRNVTKLHL